jgi:hypothetical protein
MRPQVSPPLSLSRRKLLQVALALPATLLVTPTLSDNLLGMRPDHQVFPFQQKEKMTCIRLTSPVTIDGKWTSLNEWLHTDERKMYRQQGTTGDAYLRLGHDDDNLYILIDAVGDTIFDKDGCDVFIDCLNNGGSAPQTDDFRLTVFPQTSPSPGAKPPVLRLSQGDGTTWKDFQLDPTVLGIRAAVTIDSSLDPYSNVPHWVYEIMIPRALETGPAIPSFLITSAIGLGVWVSGLTGYASGVGWQWPQVSYSQPNSWGELDLVDATDILGTLTTTSASTVPTVSTTSSSTGAINSQSTSGITTGVSNPQSIGPLWNPTWESIALTVGAIGVVGGLMYFGFKKRGARMKLNQTMAKGGFSEDESIRILRKRLASGEISREEYYKTLKDLEITKRR